MEWWTESFEDGIQDSKHAEPWERITVSQLIELIGNPGIVRTEVELGSHRGYVWVPKHEEKPMVSWSEYEGYDVAFHFKLVENLKIAWKESQLEL